MLGTRAATESVATMNRNRPETTVVMTIDAPIEAAFDYIAPINLMHIFAEAR